MKRLSSIIQQAFSRISKWCRSVWDLDLGSLSRWQRSAARLFRMVELVWKGFKSDECLLHASSLTFRSLMAIVPVLALSLALARVFGGADLAREQVLRRVDELASDWVQEDSVVSSDNTSGVQNADQPGSGPAGVDALPEGGEAVHGDEAPAVSASQRLANELAQRTNDLFELIENLEFAKLGGVGLVLLLWMVISVLGKVEESFNRVWGVTSGRPFWRKFTDYLSVIIVMPFLVTAASSLSIAEGLGRFLGSGAEEAARGLMDMPLLRELASLLASGVLFSFVLMFMPNTKVKFSAAWFGGLVVALLFSLWLKLCMALQLGVSRNDILFGSFALVPILLAWVYVSWEIVLLGAEVAFAWQNVETYSMERGAAQASPNAMVLMAVAIILEMTRRMDSEGGVLRVSMFAHDKQLSVRMVNVVVEKLIGAGLVAQAEADEGNPGLVLLRSPARLKVVEVVRLILNGGVSANELGLKESKTHLPEVVMAWDANLSESLDLPFSKLAAQGV